VRPIRLLFDENVSRDLERALKRGSPATQMFRVGHPPAPPIRTSDPQHLLWCETERALFISHDRSTMPGHHADHQAAGHLSWGVLLIRKKLRRHDPVGLRFAGISNGAVGLDFRRPQRCAGPSPGS